jgi:hypothetical protein
MAEQLIEKGKSQDAPPRLACRLRKKTTGRAAAMPSAGEVELVNVSDRAVEIEITIAPLQYLDLLVRGPDGTMLSDFHYGNLFSPVEKPYFLRLGPGETYTRPVSLLGNVTDEKNLLPGRYTVQAVYEYDALKAVSEPLQFELAP